MTVQAGDETPDFEAKVTDGDSVDDFRLADELGDGPVVLGFFPFAFTEVCENQMIDLKENLAALEDEGATVFGVSVDSPFALQRFHEDNGFGFPLVSDYNREAVEALGLTYDQLMGLEEPAKRSTLVLDDEGTVAWAWTTDDPGTKPDVAEIEGVVRKVREGQTPD
jgi:peroxiredoxin